ncbi:MAG: GyrI-like domain-containing protein [Ruminococcus sp.]|uniref:GyrI-like domain-containing protein n=1 Tax=Ruminococcus sp. TaxID=41978 RepID=UPI0025DDFA2B|nr:GyrI-like domain-containing protein [Ruminococcus sp.]MCR4794184.1 GyrI-like domain-containing protein [Ruminococcus sp.]
MAFDYKKEYKEYYMPKNKPAIVDIPSMNFIAVRGEGDPNTEGGEYKQAIELLYGIAYTIKMSKKTDYHIEGYFDYVVPPLEGLWQQEGTAGIDYSRKSDFKWTAMIRVPDFVTKSDFDWAVEQATKKKKQDFSKVEFMTLEEGLCVQCMHMGSYDDEPATVALMDSYADEMGYDIDISDSRLHHEIYLSDPRKTAPEKLKTVVRHPVKKR